MKSWSDKPRSTALDWLTSQERFASAWLTSVALLSKVLADCQLLMWLLVLKNLKGS